MNLMHKPLTTTLAALLGMILLASSAQADKQSDRFYEMGDSSFEGATAGNAVGAFGTFDSEFSFNPATDFIDLGIVGGGPIYRAITGRPDGGGGLGLEFVGSNSDFVRGKRLGDPGTSAKSTLIGGARDYFGTHERGLQLWAKPGVASGAQTLVMDTNQHGVRINDDGFYSMRYAGIDHDTKVLATAGVWRHILVVADDSGAKMYIDGNGEAAASGSYNFGDGSLADPGDTSELVVGSNTAGTDSIFTGGTEEFYTGILDDLELFVTGSNELGTIDYGTFDYKADNDFIAGTVTLPANPLDLNNDTNVDIDDVDLFVAGWLTENTHNGVRFADLDTISNGDFTEDGIVDLDDWALLNAASPALGALVLQAFAAVPEPGSFLLMAMAGLLGMPTMRRRARRS